MRKCNILFIGYSFMIILSSTYFAQEWSTEQKEVWQVVETYNEMISKSDVKGLMSYIDDSYSEWTYELDAPIDKSTLKTILDYWFPNIKSHYLTLTPDKIWVNGDYAYVHYYFNQYFENNEGKNEWEKGRWTDILIKKDGKWILVGGHGGVTSK